MSHSSWPPDDHYHLELIVSLEKILTFVSVLSEHRAPNFIFISTTTISMLLLNINML